MLLTNLSPTTRPFIARPGGARGRRAPNHCRGSQSETLRTTWERKTLAQLHAFTRTFQIVTTCIVWARGPDIAGSQWVEWEVGQKLGRRSISPPPSGYYFRSSRAKLCLPTSSTPPRASKTVLRNLFMDVDATQDISTWCKTNMLVGQRPQDNDDSVWMSGLRVRPHVSV